VDDNSAAALKNSKGPNYKKINHTEIVEENAALRKMSASLNGDLTKLAERMLLLADDGDEEICEAREAQCRQYYARVILLGRKPERFNESTTIPTFLEFGSANVCRVSQKAVRIALGRGKEDETGERPAINLGSSLEERICTAFAETYILALAKELPKESIMLCTQRPSDARLARADNRTYLVVTLVQMVDANNNNQVQVRPRNASAGNSGSISSKRFIHKNRIMTPKAALKAAVANSKSSNSRTSITNGLVETTVAQEFPCALSRQRVIITSEYSQENRAIN